MYPAQLAVTNIAATMANVAKVRASRFCFCASPTKPNIPTKAKMASDDARLRVPPDGGSSRMLGGAKRKLAARATASGVACTSTLILVETALPEGVRVDGLNPHSAPAGKPEQEKLTACLNPFSGVTVSERLPSPPATTVNDELLIANEKSPVGAAATVTVVAAEVEAE